MFDIVVNHMAWSGDHPSVQYDRLIPFSDKKYYHDYCKLSDETSQTDVRSGAMHVNLANGMVVLARRRYRHSTRSQDGR